MRKYYTKRLKYRRRQSTKKQKNKSKTGRKNMTGGYSSAFIAYINQMLTYCSREGGRLPEFGTPIGNILNNIRTGLFTNKLDNNGRFTFSEKEPLMKLRDDTVRFWKWTKELNELSQKPPVAENFKLYRTCNMSTANAVRNAIQPIPISCTWDINFARSWLGQSPCCILEINLSTDCVFLPTAPPVGQVHPNDNVQKDINSNYRIFNPDQREVIVGPCTLMYSAITVINGMTVYQYNAVPVNDTKEITANFNIVNNNGCFF